MRVLVTGAAGGLGRYVVRELRRRPDVVVLAPDHAALDVTDWQSVRAYLAGDLPDAIVHLAGLANVDRCSREPTEAVRQNATGTLNVVT